MTQKGKCDICRQRKCDQTKPKCKRCRVKGRPCTYDAASYTLLAVDPAWEARQLVHRRLTERQQKQFEGLQLVTSSESTAGSGSFHVLAPTRCKDSGFADSQGSFDLGDPASSTPLTSTNSRLASRWAWTVSQKAPGINAFETYGGHLTSLLPSRIGVSQSLDDAAAYFLDCHMAYRTRSSTALINTQRSGARAVRSLRLQMSQEMLGVEQGYIVESIILHYAAEMFRKLEAYHYVIHLLALSKLMRSRWHEGKKFDSFDRMVLIENYFDEVFESLIAGQDSGFDTTPPLAFFSRSSDPQSSEFENSTLQIMQQVVKIPRLARCVRSYRGCKNEQTLSYMVSLATEIYQNDPIKSVQTTLLDSFHLLQNQSDDPEEITAIPYHAHFTSIRAFLLYLDYHCYKVLITGIIQNMHKFGIAIDSIDISEVQQADLDSARAIAISTAYAMGIDSELPIVGLRAVAPIQIAYGAWTRHRSRNSNVDEGPHYMQRRCLENVKHILARWGHQEPFKLTHEHHDLVADAMVGGPLPLYLIGRVKWDQLNTAE